MNGSYVTVRGRDLHPVETCPPDAVGAISDQDRALRDQRMGAAPGEPDARDKPGSKPWWKFWA
jgi:hypothetical protein